jgi:hypothetical protein
MTETMMTIWCCGCDAEVSARLTDGREIYAHRPDLYDLPFWRCDTCHNYVGCHHKTANRTAPLGCIPTHAIKNARHKLHAAIDPIWQSNRMGRREIYREIAKRLGIKEFHTADIRDVATANAVLVHVSDIVAGIAT